MMKTVCLLLLVGSVTSESSLSSVISRLLGEARSSRSQVPVIMIVSNKALQSSSLGLSSSSEERQDSDQQSLEADSLWKIFAKHDNRRPSSLDRRPHPPHNALFIQNPRADLYRPRNLFKPNKPQRPKYNSLLALRNRLRCGARDECKEECAEIPQKKKEIKCEKKCEVKYDCDETEDDENPSTRAPRYSDSEEKRDCPRC